MTDYAPNTKVVRDNYHIAVEAVDDRWIRHGNTHQKRLDQLEKIKREIARHVDDIAGIAVVFDSETVCAYCAYRWEWCIDDEGIPACCEKAVADYETQTGKTIS